MYQCDQYGQLTLLEIEPCEEIKKPPRTKAKKPDSVLIAIPFYYIDFKDVDLFGNPHWEFRSPLREGKQPLNTGVAPRTPIRASLTDILESNPDPKYDLTTTACVGILRRAGERGKELPEQLKMALTIQAGLSKVPYTPTELKAYHINQRDEGIDLNGVIREIGRDTHILTQTEIIALAVTAAVGLLICLLGLKIIRVWAALTGLIFGLAVGVTAGGLLGLNGTGVLITGGVLGLILAVLGAALYRVGVFLTVFVLAGSISTYLIVPQDWIGAAVCLAIGLVAAILAVRFVVALTIIVTSVYGAAIAGTAIYHLLPVTGDVILIVLCVVICIIGILVQLLLESRKQKKKSLQKAAEIREEKSTANEVERARAMMADLGEMPDGETTDDGSSSEKFQEEEFDEEDNEEDEFEEDDMTIIEYDTEDLSEENKNGK